MANMLLSFANVSNVILIAILHSNHVREPRLHYVNATEKVYKYFLSDNIQYFIKWKKLASLISKLAY